MVNFPNAPTADQIHTEEGQSWQWKTDRWIIYTAPAAAVQPGFIESPESPYDTSSGSPPAIFNLPIGPGEVLTHVRLVLSRAKLSGSNNLRIQFGTISGWETTNYQTSEMTLGSGNVSTYSTNSSAFNITRNFDSARASGVIDFARVGTTAWMGSGVVDNNGTHHTLAGRITPPTETTRVRVDASSGNNFDGGSVSCYYQVQV